ncbi:MAG TPA: energy transducer TonB [Rhizomicrobium sp.]|nr:energy transducer TonB [Rhizomicrobium sp.]
MRIHLAILLTLIAGPAWAEGTTASAILDRGDSGTCQQSTFAGMQSPGMAAFSFLVTAEGSAKDAALLQSSGNREADAAARQCLETQRYKPTLRYDVPIEELWVANVTWWADKAPEVAVNKGPNECSNYYPTEALAAGAQGTTKFTLRMHANNMSGFSLTQSSGNIYLDEGAVLCTSQDPVTHGAMDSQGNTWKVTVTWTLHPHQQDAQHPESNINLSDHVINMILSPPDPAKDAHDNSPCLKNYPDAARKNHAEGVAKVYVFTTPEGKKEHARIEMSSGDPDLDAASVQCAIDSHMGTQPGKHILYFVWDLGDPPTPAEPFKPCTSFGTVTADMVRGIRGSTTIAYNLMPDGTVKTVKTLLSSGNSELDRTAELCIKPQRYNTSTWKLPAEGMTKYLSVDWRKALAAAK